MEAQKEELKKKAKKKNSKHAFRFLNFRKKPDHMAYFSSRIILCFSIPIQ